MFWDCLSGETLLPEPVAEEILQHYRVIDAVEIGTYEILRRRSIQMMVPK